MEIFLLLGFIRGYRPVSGSLRFDKIIFSIRLFPAFSHYLSALIFLCMKTDTQFADTQIHSYTDSYTVTLLRKCATVILSFHCIIPALSLPCFQKHEKLYSENTEPVYFCAGIFCFIINNNSAHIMYKQRFPPRRLTILFTNL